MRGFIFDFNGTLFRDADYHLRAWKSFAQERCGIDISDENYKKNIEGRNDRSAITYLLGNELNDHKILELTEIKEAMYRALCFSERARMKLTEGAPELFDYLARHDIPRTIATASCKSNVDFYVAEFNLSKWFDHSKIIYDDGMIPGKPEPDFYLRAAEAIGVPPAQCAVAEDSAAGVMSAVSAGIGYIAVVDTPERRGAASNMKEVNSVITSFHEFDRSVFGKAYT